MGEVAAEIAGILKEGVPVVVAEQQEEAREVILKRAKELSSPVIETGAAYRIENSGMEEGRARARVTRIASGLTMEIAVQLPGRFQLQNALTAVAAARVLQRQGFRITTDAIREGIAATVWPGRLEKLHARPDVYLDGAHNPGAARELAGFWEEQLADPKNYLLYGAARGKGGDQHAGI